MLLTVHAQCTPCMLLTCIIQADVLARPLCTYWTEWSTSSIIISIRAGHRTGGGPVRQRQRREDNHIYVVTRARRARSYTRGGGRLRVLCGYAQHIYVFVLSLLPYRTGCGPYPALVLLTLLLCCTDAADSACSVYTMYATDLHHTG